MWVITYRTRMSEGVRTDERCEEGRAQFRGAPMYPPAQQSHQQQQQLVHIAADNRKAGREWDTGRSHYSMQLEGRVHNHLFKHAHECFVIFLSS